MMKRGIIYFTPLREIGFTPAPTLGKGTGSHGFWWAKVRPAIPSRGQPKQQGTFPLLPGEKAGMRAGYQPLCFCHQRA